ncbi:serine/threonine protein kinase [Salinibacillus xinjiangensis]|uniref:Protein kinase n=1 Tax=Salinibacillus xinjiangensis TaxID=1229268 RepID=A0A6G1X4M8_9BACI|nr:protein kinase family protein [Salinibacillus xinjiangensis]MRG85902.1 protein kinase [Salinibacillus xinjiangensis]
MFLSYVHDLLEKEIPIGHTVHARYQIESLLGKGSYGISYLAWDLIGEQQVVLKQNRKRKGKRGLRTFTKEAEILKQFNHPSIPRLMDEFKIEKSTFLVMEYKAGKTFEQLIFEDEYVYQEQEVFSILRRILDIVKTIHYQNIVHLDLRIPNIIYRDGQISVIDFGLAKYLHEKSTRQMRKNPFRNIRVESDFFALGHFALFLLYSNFEPDENSRKRDSWLDELTLSKHATYMIKRLLQLNSPYSSVDEVIGDVDNYLKVEHEQGLEKSNL